MANKPKSNKSTAKRSSHKKSSSSNSTQPLEVNKKTSASVRQIENGFLVTESGTTGTGRNQSWWEKQYYSPTNPLAGIKGGAMRFGKKK